MSELYPLETDNENSLQELNWAIATSQGEFSLILALCNATSVRRRLMQSLQASSEVEIQEIVLDKSVKTIYQTIQNSISQAAPQALVVSGLESVKNLEQVLITANQVREEFRKNFHFPLVLWVTDEVLQKFIRVAPDLHSWSTTVEFAIASADLINFIEQTAEEIFNRVLAAGAGRYLDQVALNLQIGSSRRVELEAAAHELQNRRLSLSVELEASLEFLLGRATSNFMEESRQHYERSLALFEQTDQFLERRGGVLYSLGLWWTTFAVLHLPEQENSRGIASEYFQRAIAVFEQANRQDLVAKFINALGVVLQQLQRWEELEAVANKALSLHRTYEHPLKLARAYGFKAEVALAKSMPTEAEVYAEQALTLLESYQRDIQQPVSEEIKADLEWENSYHRGWYLFALGRSQAALNQPELALQTLETAKTDTKAQYDPELYIGILAQLRDNYFKKGEYLTAFNIKQYQRSIEQQYSYRAFIGAGRLQPQQQVNNPALALAEKPDAVAQEISASGRQPDINRLIERMGRHDHKLTIIHGQSGVGKSSILQAGLIPALKQKSIGTRDVLPVLQQVYPDWARELGDRLTDAIAHLTPFAQTPYEGEVIPRFPSENSILEQLVKHDDYNLLTVLIFDQFEEFFFVYKDPGSRKPFYEFLRECLDIPFVKVILSLREDYLYYLLECNNRLADFEVINNNILDKDILYYLDNFSPKDAKAVIQILTAKTPFVFETLLIDELVKDLARDLGEVRPIELQVVGVQLQTERITKLEQYRQQGPKEKFVGRFLAEIVQDCGTENEQIAKLVLYLLTDENNLRPLKTRADLELELEVQSEKLDLILEILIKSGLIFKVRAVPTDRYQLVHDYLVPFVRQQQSARLIAELEKEREQRKLTEAKLNEVLKQQLLEARRGLLWKVSLGTISGALAIFLPLILVNQNNAQLLAMSSDAKGKLNSNRNLEALIETIKAGKRLQQWWSIGVEPETKMKVKTALQDAVYTTREINTLEGHTDSVTKVSFSPDGQKIASGSADGMVIIWSRDGRKINSFKAHNKKINSLNFSPDNKNLLSGSEDKTLKLWTLAGKEIAKFKGHEDEITSSSFSPDGQKIISASKNGEIKLWNRYGKQLQTLKGHIGSIDHITFSPDGKLIASTDEYTIRLWNLNGKEIKKLKDKGTGVIFSPNNQIIATTFYGSIRLMNHDGSFKKWLYSNLPYGVQYLNFSSDGKTINSAYFDQNYIQIWKVNVSNEKTISFYFNGHRNKITSVSFSPDGKMAASGSEDKTIKLWNLEKNNFITTNDSSTISNIDFSHNAQILASVFDGYVKLWQRNSTLETILPGVNSNISFSVDNHRLVSASQDSITQIWHDDGNDSSPQILRGEVVDGSFSPDARTIALVRDDHTVELLGNGKLIQILKGHKDKVYKISFSKDGETLATVSLDKTIKLWRRDGKLINSIKTSVKDVALNRNGKTLAVLDDDNTVKFLRQDGQLIKALKSDEEMSVLFSTDGEIVAINNRSHNINKTNIELWRMNGTYLTTLQSLENNQSISALAFTPDSQIIGTSNNYEKRLILWKLNGSLVSVFDKGNVKAFSANSQTVATVEQNNIVKLWKFDGTFIRNIQVKNERAALRNDRSAQDIMFSPDGKTIAIRTASDTIELWTIEGKFLSLLKGLVDNKIERLINSSTKLPIAFSSDSKTIAIQTSENTVQFWRINSNNNPIKITSNSINVQGNLVRNVISIPNSNKIAINVDDDIVKLWQIPDKLNKKIQLLKTYSGHKNLITSVSISPNNKIIASASYDNTVKLLRTADGTLLCNFTGHKNKVNSVIFSPDGKLIASASDDNTVKIWQPDCKIIKSFEEHGNGVTDLSFSPDGKLIASAGKDNTVKIWSLETNENKTFNNDTAVTSVSFSPDGKMIASADSSTVKLWSIDGTLLSTYERFGNSSVSFSPDGKSIAAAGEGISVWDFDLNQLLKRGCDMARDYLKYNPKAKDDRHLCDDIYNQKQ